MRIAGRSIAGMWVTAFWTGGLWAGLVGCGIAVDPADLGSTMQAIGTCPSGVPSVSLASTAFLVDGKYSLDHALHVSPAGLQGNPGCVYVPPERWPQPGPIYLRSGQKILSRAVGGCGTRHLRTGRLHSRWICRRITCGGGMRPETAHTASAAFGQSTITRDAPATVESGDSTYSPCQVFR
jgi:hypothetical protein